MMPDNTVQREVARARERLLDLSLRNRLLNYRPARHRSLRIVDEIPREVFNILVLSETDMRFRGAMESSLPTEENEDIEQADVSIWQPPGENGDTDPKHADRLLQTELEPEKLQKRLFKISAQAHGFFEEQGYSILYVALGFLHWTEAEHSEVVHRAPVILMPVELNRAGVGAAYRISWSGDDLYTNISLQAKLREQDIALPDFEMPEGKEEIDAYFETVSASVRAKKEWKVATDIYLDFFSFAKFVMWRDLAPEAWPTEHAPASHPVLHEMYGVLVPNGSGSELLEEDIDEKLTSADSYHVLDADPPQICAIAAVKSGRNLVVEGPPGTGKSQTIVNAIAELLASGKTMLFVSEKVAALDVVKSRLDSVGIGDACLKLHSHNTGRKAFYESIRRALERPSGRGGTNTAAAYDEHDGLKRELNRFAELLRRPVGGIRWSLYRLYGLWAQAQRHFESKGLSLPTLGVRNPTEISVSEWEAARARLTDVVRLSATVWPIMSNPWRGTRPPLLLPGDEHSMQGALNECSLHWRDLTRALCQLSESCALGPVQSLNQVDRAVEAARLVAGSQPNDPSVLLNPEWNTLSPKAQDLISDASSFHERRQVLLRIFDDRVFETVSRTQLEEFESEAQRFAHVIRPAFWQSWRSARSMYGARAPVRTHRLIADFRSLVECVELRMRLREADEAGKRFFGTLWLGEASAPATLQQFADWMVQFRRELLAHILTPRTCDLISGKVVDAEEIAHHSQRVTGLAANLREALRNLNGLLRATWSGRTDGSFEDADLHALGERLEVWSRSIDGLINWSRYVQIRDENPDRLSDAAIALLEDGTIQDASDALQVLEGGFADALLRDAIRTNRILRSFAGPEHEGRIRDFAELDRRIKDWNRERLTQQLLGARPFFPPRISRNDPMWTLRHQLGLQRPRLPIRRMLSLAGRTIQQVKPCFMMSPLSVAQFLAPGSVEFDVVLFDEASQIRTEDALGAAVRGKQMVVMGDTQQLPPTSFFDRMAGGEDPDEETEEPLAAEQNESILQRCKTGFDSKTLSWHYRSRHESLIAVSNREFYENRLYVFPSAHARVDHLGVHLVHVPESVYDRGRSRTNRIEAERVADAVFEHARHWPAKSLGVGTFSVAQKAVIEEAIEARRRVHPELEDFFGKEEQGKFFVKNLESIQGDERDVIFVSVGYGRDETGRPSRHFGPLNHDGGEKRLNVLLTRARERCVIFTNFLADDLEVTSSTPVGVRVLREYLAYAKDRRWPIVGTSKEDTESLFEDAVAQFLCSKGYEIRKQVGCAKYFIDMAVVHPDHPGRYVIGIECDGAMYHSSRVARERDRLRQEVLEGLGWRLHRIWSTDWFWRLDATRTRLLRAVEAAMIECGGDI
jgi:very-short-patch-repair endonuclease